MSKLFIWGASGHGKVVLDVAHAARQWTHVVFLDDACREGGRTFMGCAVIGKRDQLPLLRERGYTDFLIGIGDNATRAGCFAEAVAQGFLPVAAIHPSAIVSPSASIGAGTVVMPRVVVNAGAVIGEDCILNTGAIVEHDCVIGHHSHLSPGVVLGGGVRVGGYSHLGLNASVLPLAVVGEYAVVGAGAVVLTSVAAGETVVGVPAKTIAAARQSGEFFRFFAELPK